MYSSIISLFCDFIGSFKTSGLESPDNKIISAVTFDILDTENSSIFQQYSSKQVFQWDGDGGGLWGMRGGKWGHHPPHSPMQLYTGGPDDEELRETIRKHWRSVFGDTDKHWIITIQVHHNSTYPWRPSEDEIDGRMEEAYLEGRQPGTRL